MAESGSEKEKCSYLQKQQKMSEFNYCNSVPQNCAAIEKDYTLKKCYRHLITHHINNIETEILFTNHFSNIF